MGTDSESSQGGSQAPGLVLKALVLLGGALLLKRMRKSTTRWDHARVVAESLSGEKFSQEQACRDPDNYFNLRMLTCPATDIVDGSRVLYFEQAFRRAPQKPFRQRFYMVKPCPKEMRCDVELSSYAIRDVEEYKNFCERRKDQRPQTEEVIADIAEHLTTIHLSQCERGKHCLFEGSTPPGGFPNSWNGASYCTSELTIHKNGELHTLDRGYDNEGKQLWGSKGGVFLKKKTHRFRFHPRPSFTKTTTTLRFKNHDTLQSPSPPFLTPAPLQTLKGPSIVAGLLGSNMDLKENKFFSAGLVFIATIIVAKLLTGLLRSGSNRRLPPAINSLPVVGGLLRFMKGPIVMIREEYQKLGSVFTLNIVNRKITFFIGPEVSSHFFKAPEAELSQQEVYQFNVPTFGPGVVFDVDYSVRQEQFRFFTEALRVTKLKSYVDQMVVEAEDYFSKWGECGEVDLKYELEHLIILTASRCLLGREVRDKLFDDVSALFHDLDNGMRPISVIFPYLPIPAHRRRDKARARIAQIFSTIINSRKLSGKPEDDMLQCFIESKYKDGRPTTEGEITGLLIAALFAGQHTSSITSTWTGAYMLRYKQYLAAALDEQKQLLKKHGDKVDHDILSEMDVLYRCIKEALRLHPPLIMLLRQSHSDFTVKTKEGVEYDIPKGHIVATSPAFANRLPHIFKDPDTYDPDRFAPGREEDKAAGAFSYISFGGGRHGCLEIDWNAMVVGVKGQIVLLRIRARGSSLLVIRFYWSILPGFGFD
ncbi:hypothetical protein J5N97_021498 [Dioscorea zingiberensis]|uniref:Obtusifoliol 14-alpha demethylase n=1 Tax=Dioscorea zingiberensis TaxID=325984 RepID=A0A9D5CIH4_9LILI|nr:hypothetical protein J5N97_021498 [Dioscorea zingiberensis]